MKKLFLILSFAASLFLTSCEVHFGKNIYNVHWVFIALPILIALFVVGIYFGKKKFVCPNCNKTFYVGWFKYLFSGHVGDERSLRCPHCKKVGACYPSYDQEENK